MEGMVKTVSNMYGGNIAGMEAVIPTLKELGIKKFFTTPFANGDNRFVAKNKDYFYVEKI